MIDRFVPSSSSRVIDYVAVMTIKLAPQLEVNSDRLSDVRQVIMGRVFAGDLSTEINSKVRSMDYMDYKFSRSINDVKCGWVRVFFDSRRPDSSIILILPYQ